LWENRWSSRPSSEHAQVVFAFRFDFCFDFGDSCKEVVLADFCAIVSDGEVACFSGDCFDLSSTKSYHGFDECVLIEFSDFHVVRVNLEYFFAAFHVWYGYVYESIKASRSCDCRVQDVFSVCAPDDFDIVERFEPVDFCEKLHEGALDFALTGGADVHTNCCDGVEFVDEDDAWCFFPSYLEDFLDEFCALSDEFLDEFAADNFKECALCARSNGFCEQGLARARWAVEQDAFWRIDADFLE